MKGIESFLVDIAPFFYQRRITYVDVGAFNGEVFEGVLESGLKVREAHLIEPNSSALNRAKALAAKFTGNSVDFHHLAMGARAGRVRLHAANRMTRVVAEVNGDTAVPGDDSGFFDVECSTLDLLSENFSERRVSILKIDVEGYELQVLEGAAKLLSEQRADCIYIEAGLSRDGRQQCYLRDIEDALQAHGYRIFRIYEQHNEWMEDSPLLRRVNVAFFSPGFAKSNPYRLTRELAKARSELERVKETSGIEATALRAQLSAAMTLEQKFASFRSESERLVASVTASAAAAQEAVKAKQSAVQALEQQLASLRSENESLAAQAAASTAAAQEAVKAKHSGVQALEQQLASLRSENESLAARAKTSAAAAQDAVKAKQSAVQALEQQLASLRSENESLAARATASAADVQEAVKARQSAVRTLEQQLALLRSEIEGLAARATVSEAAAQQELDVKQKALLMLEHQLASLQGEFNRQRRDASALALEAEQALALAMEEGAGLRTRLQRLELESRRAQSLLAITLNAIGDANDRALATQADASAARSDIDRLKRSRTYRLARTVAEHRRSLEGWLTVLPALWRARLRVARMPTGRAKDPRSHIVEFSGALSTVTLPSSKSKQDIVLPASPTPYELCIKVFSPNIEDALVDVRLTLRDESANARVLVDGAESRPVPVAVRQESTLQVPAWRTTRLVRVVESPTPVVLGLRAASDRPCTIKCWLRAADARKVEDGPSTASPAATAISTTASLPPAPTYATAIEQPVKAPIEKAPRRAFQGGMASRSPAGPVAAVVRAWSIASAHVNGALPNSAPASPIVVAGGGHQIADVGGRADRYLDWVKDERNYIDILRDREKLLVHYFNSDDAFFLVNFGLFLIAYKKAAHSVGFVLGERIWARYGQRLRAQLSATAYRAFLTRFVFSLSRVGKHEAAMALLDEAVEQVTDKADRAHLLRAKADCCWVRDPKLAVAALTAADALKAPTSAEELFRLLLTADVGADPALPRGKSSQRHLIHANLCLQAGDRVGYWEALNRYLGQQDMAPVRCDTAPIFDYAGLSADIATMGSKSDRDAGKLVSVIMTAYNSAVTLRYAIESILTQTHTNLELLIVDDGSTDATREMLAEFEKRDRRVRVLLNETNLGTYGAKNRAMGVASGRYITFHDSDDWAHPQRLATHVEFMEAQPDVMASRSDWLRTTADGKVLFKRWGRAYQHPNPASSFLRREVIDLAGFFDNVRFSADTEYWLRLRLMFGPERVVQLKKCLGLGRSREDSLTKSGHGAFNEDQYSPTRCDYFYSVAARHAVCSVPEELHMPLEVRFRPFWAPEDMIQGLPPNDYGSAFIPIRYGCIPGGERVPVFVFGISLTSAQASKDWEKTKRLLGCTLQSVLAQTDGRFMVLICGHEFPDVPEMNDPRVTFFECDAPPPKDSSRFRRDKMRKRWLLGVAMREMGGGYFFPLDADDLVHKNVVEYTLRDDNKRGYLVDKGYVLDESNAKLALVQDVWDADFNYVCGSSAVIHFEVNDLPSWGDAGGTKVYFNQFESHAYWPNVARESGRPLQRLPFAAGVYVVNHSQNLSFGLQRAGERAENIVSAVAQHHLGNAESLLVTEFGQEA